MSCIGLLLHVVRDAKPRDSLEIIYFNIFIQDNKFSKAVFQLGPVITSLTDRQRSIEAERSAMITSLTDIQRSIEAEWSAMITSLTDR